jgi:hypothetical protein
VGAPVENIQDSQPQHVKQIAAEDVTYGEVGRALVYRIN